MRSGGFEPPTTWFVARYSIQLSYERTVLRDANYRDTRCLSQYVENRIVIFFQITATENSPLFIQYETMSGLIALLLLIFGIWYWQDTAMAHEIALCQCRKTCRELGLQLLDQTVERQRSRLIRTSSGILVLRREYRFEFTTTGEQRYAGFICIIRKRVHSLNLDQPDKNSDGTSVPHQIFVQPEQQEH